MYISRTSTSRAFSLPEILIVMVVLAILAAFAIPEIRQAQIQNYGKAETENLRTIQTAKLAWMKDNPGAQLPSSSEAAKAALLPYLKYGWPKSPWGLEYQNISDLNEAVSSLANGDVRYEPKGTAGDSWKNGYNDLGLSKNVYLLPPEVNSNFASWTGGGNYTYTPGATPTPTPPPADVTLTLNVSPPGGGSTTGQGTYPVNSTPTVQAFPAAGFTWGNWTGDVTGVGNPQVVALPTSKTATAVFLPITYDLTLTYTGSGSVTGAGTYDWHSNAAYTAVPATGWHFDRWEQDIPAGAQNGSILMDGNKTGHAVFVIDQYTLDMRVNPLGAGVVSPAGVTTHDYNSTVGISSSAFSGWNFTGFTGLGSGDLDGVTLQSPTSSGGSGSVPMTKNRVLIANFSPIYNLTVLVDPVGAGSPIGNGATFSPGQSASFGVTPTGAWTVASWSGDYVWDSATGSGDGTTGSLVMTSNKTVVAHLVNATPTVDVYTYIDAWDDWTYSSQPWPYTLPITYSIGTYNMDSDNVAETVVSTVTFPPGTYIDYVDTYRGFYDIGPDGRTITWQLGDLNPSWDGGSLSVVVYHSGAGTFVTPTVATTTSSDRNLLNNSASVSVEMIAPSPDLSVNKYARNAVSWMSQPWSYSDGVSYQIDVYNNGSDGAPDSMMVDTVPAGMVVDPDSLSGYPGSCVLSSDGRTITWDMGYLNQWDGGSLTYTAYGSAAGTYDNTATVSTSSTETDYTNNTSTVSVELIDAAADLSAVKSATNQTRGGATGWLVGDNIRYRVRVLNAGPSSANSVSLTDVLPVGANFVTGSIAVDTGSASYSGGQIVWNVGSLPQGYEYSLYYTVRFATANTSPGYINTATVSSPVTDPNPGNNTTTVTVPINPKLVDLRMDKSSTDVTSSNWFVGDTIRYSLAVYNAGPHASETNTVVDTLPAGAVVTPGTISGPGTWVVSGDGSTITWEVGNIYSGWTQTLTYDVVYSAPGDYTNTSVVTGVYPDPVPGDNTDTETDTIVPPNTDMAITKTADSWAWWDGPEPLRPGDEFQFNVTVSNRGPVIGTNVVVEDYLPAEVTLANGNPDWDFYYWVGLVIYDDATGYIRWEVGDMEPNTSAWLQISVKIGPLPTITTISNTATVTNDVLDLDLTNNSSTATVEALPDGPDLEVTKAVSSVQHVNQSSTGPEQDIAVGDIIWYSVTIRNIGTQNSGAFDIADYFPEGSHFYRTDTWYSQTWPNTGYLAWYDQAVYTWNYLPWTLGTGELTNTYTNLAPGAQISFTVGLYMDTVGTKTQTVTATLPTDINPANNTASVTNEVIVPTIDVGVSKELYAVGSSTSFTNGNNYINWQYARSPERPDGVTPGVGDVVEYAVRVTNNSNYPLTYIPLTDVFPDGIVPITDAVAGGTISGQTVTWLWGWRNDGYINYLHPGQTDTLFVWGRVVTAGVKTNTITAAMPGDVNPANDVATVTHTIPLESDPVDFVLTKTTDRPAVHEGDIVRFVVTVNQNPVGGMLQAGRGVSIVDTLPPGCTVVSAGILNTPLIGVGGPTIPRNGVFTWTPGGTTVTWNFDELLILNGWIAAFEVYVQLPATGLGTFTNTATVTSTTPEATPADNTDTADVVVTPQDYDVAIEKGGFAPSGVVADLTGNIAVGSSYVYTLKVSNVGSLAISGFSVQDVLPAGMVLNSIVASDGSSVPFTQSGQTVSFTASGTMIGTDMMGPLYNTTTGQFYYPAGSPTKSYQMFVTMGNTPGAVTNTATVSIPEPESDYSNNTSSWTVNLYDAGSADLAVTKSASPTGLKNLQNVTYTVTVSNPGVAPMENVVVTDPIPAEMDNLAFVTTNSWTGYPSPGYVSYATTGGEVRVTIPRIYPGSTLTFSYRVRANVPTLPIPQSGVTVVNTVSVSSSTPEPNMANNTATATVTIYPQVTNVKIVKTATPTVVSPIQNMPWAISPGETFTYTLAATYPYAWSAGYLDPTKIVITDYIPVELTYVSATVTGSVSGTVVYDSATRKLTITGGAFPMSSTMTVAVTVTADQPDIYSATEVTNTATIDPYQNDSGGNPVPLPDVDPTDNTSTVVVPVDNKVDLAVGKSANSPQVLVGASTGWTVTVTNNYKTKARNITVSDGLPSGYSNWSVSGPGASLISGGSFTATLPELAPGASATWYLYCTAPSVVGWYTNSVTVSSTPQEELTPQDNSASASQYVSDNGGAVVTFLNQNSVSYTRSKFGTYGSYPAGKPSPNVDIDAFKLEEHHNNNSANGQYSRNYHSEANQHYSGVNNNPTIYGKATSDTYSYVSVGGSYNYHYKTQYQRTDSTGVVRDVVSPGSYQDTTPGNWGLVSIDGSVTNAGGSGSSSYSPPHDGDGGSWSGIGYSGLTSYSWNDTQWTTTSSPDGLTWRYNSTTTRTGGGYNAGVGWDSWGGHWSWNETTPPPVPASESSTGNYVSWGGFPWYGDLGTETKVTPESLGPGQPYTTRTSTQTNKRAWGPANPSSGGGDDGYRWTETSNGELTTITEQKYEWKDKYDTTTLMSEVRSGLDSKSWTSSSSGSDTVTATISVNQDGWTGQASRERVDVKVDTRTIPVGKKLEVYTRPLDYTTKIKFDNYRRLTSGETVSNSDSRPDTVVLTFNRGTQEQTQTYTVDLPKDWNSVGSKSSGFVQRATVTHRLQYRLVNAN